jgi:hypothetical protein
MNLEELREVDDLVIALKISVAVSHDGISESLTTLGFPSHDISCCGLDNTIISRFFVRCDISNRVKTSSVKQLKWIEREQKLMQTELCSSGRLPDLQDFKEGNLQEIPGAGRTVPSAIG